MIPLVALDPQASAPYMLEQATCRAHFLVNRTGLPQDDWEDLRQEFVLDCLQRAPGFNPARGEWQAFVRGVIRNRSAVAAHRESKRVQCEALSPICEGFDPDQNERVDSARANREPASADPTASLVLSADVQRVITNPRQGCRSVGAQSRCIRMQRRSKLPTGLAWPSSNTRRRSASCCRRT